MSCKTFTVNKPLAGHDEDAPPVASEKMLIVCDGLGGGGHNTYVVNGEKRTSAYLGSRLIKTVCENFFRVHYDELCESMENPRLLMAELKSELTRELNKYVTDNGLKNIVKGKSMQMLPSTLAAVVYRQLEDRTDALVISAGDSRAFVLTPEAGLQQISTDDVFEGVDAYDKSATMTNNIRQDGEFHINYGYISLPSRCVLLVCSDGCFDYMSTPMELEFWLEVAIDRCEDVLDPSKDSLGEQFGNILVNRVLKDDCTMAGAILGYTDSAEMKLRFKSRALDLHEQYRKPHAQYEQESRKRRDGVVAPLRDMEAKIAELRPTVDGRLKDALITAFLQDADGGAGTMAGIPELVSALREFEPYTEFLRELQTADEETKRKAAEARVDLEKEEARMRLVFKTMLFEEFVRSLIPSGVRRLLTVLANPEKKRLAERYSRLQEELGKAETAYRNALAAFARGFEDFRRLELAMHKEEGEFAPLSEKFRALQETYGSYIRTQQEFDRCLEELRTFYLENDTEADEAFDKEWKKRFASHRQAKEYDDLLSGTEKCLKLGEEINRCTPLTAEAKVEKFKAYLEAHLQAFFDLVKGDAELFHLLCDPELTALTDLEAQHDELKRHATEYDEKKRAVWEDYKQGYELFLRCERGDV